MKDREIVELFLERSEAAIREAESRYGRYCRAIALRIVGSERDAEEVVSDTWLGAWNAIPPHEPEDLRTFRGKITRQNAIKCWRRRSAAKRGGETALALDNAVKQGKALYVGISNYTKAQTQDILSIFRELKTPFILNQPSYNMLNRRVEEDGLDKFCLDNGIGLAVFCPLAQGLLTGKYINGIPAGSRASSKAGLAAQLDGNTLAKLRALNDIALDRGQSMPQLALSWVLRNPAVATVLIGASRPEQIIENVGCITNLPLSPEELSKIDSILNA